jgi:hypothetical protein
MILITTHILKLESGNGLLQVKPSIWLRILPVSASFSGRQTLPEPG